MDLDTKINPWSKGKVMNRDLTNQLHETYKTGVKEMLSRFLSDVSHCEDIEDFDEYIHQWVEKKFSCE